MLHFCCGPKCGCKTTSDTSSHGSDNKRFTCNGRVVLANRFADQLPCCDAHNGGRIRILLAYLYSFGLLVGSDGKTLASAGNQDTTHFDVHLTSNLSCYKATPQQTLPSHYKATHLSRHGYPHVTRLHTSADMATFTLQDHTPQQTWLPSHYKATHLSRHATKKLIILAYLVSLFGCLSHPVLQC